MAGSRRKEALIGGGVSLVFVALAIIVVLHQPSDSTPTLASNTPPGTVAPQVLGTVFTIPSPSPDPAESSVLAPEPVQTELITSTITALSTVIVSGKPVVQTAFRTTTATSRVTLPPQIKTGPTVLSTRTFLATITQAGVVSIVTQTATATETLPAVTNTATQTRTATATVTHTSISPGPTTTIISPGPTVTNISVSPGPTTTIISPGPTVTVTETPSPVTVTVCIDSVTSAVVPCP